MIDLKKYEKTFTEASASDQGVVLVNSNKTVFKFDDYIRDNYVGVCGIDAIFDFSCKGANCRWFLEFKSGKNYTVSDVTEQVLSSLIIYFKDEEELRDCLKKYYFYLVIQNHRARVINGIKKTSVENESKSKKNREQNFQVLFYKLKKIFFIDAEYKTGNEIENMLNMLD